MGLVFSSHPNTRVRLPEKSALLPVSNQGDEKYKSLPLAELVHDKCSTLFSDFNPPWWMFNGHSQTAYCVLGDFTRVDEVVYDRKYLRLRDGGTIGVDFTPADHQAVRADAPIIVVTHGLTGGPLALPGSYESYVRCVLHPACKPEAEGGLGFRAVVVNFRGCAGVPITSQRLYSAGETGDLRAALAYIRSQYPNAPLLGLGFSIGGNIMTRYIAEEGQHSRLVSACSLACPWNLVRNNEVLKSTLVGKHVYAKALGTNLLNIATKHAAALSQDPEHPVSKALSQALQLKNPTLELFDTVFTRIAGGPSPNFPYESVSQYYEEASSHNVLADIKIPFLAINSADDPVVQDVPMEGSENEYIVMALTSGGGHLGWFESDNQGNIRRWIVNPVLEWLQLHGKDVIHEIKEERVDIDADGLVREEGLDEPWCRVLESGDSIHKLAGQSLLQGL
ncbi:hypothetical protein ONZ45_g13567 [Pleurotus djamor]|nr:hypothetical protein ONZ45_g13567 [Pleurotus djamor]